MVASNAVILHSVVDAATDVTMNSGKEWRENVVLCAQTVKMAASTVTAQSSTGSGAAIHTVGFGLSLLNTVHPVSPS